MSYGDLKKQVSEMGFSKGDQCALRKMYFDKNPKMAGGPIPYGEGNVEYVSDEAKDILLMVSTINLAEMNYSIHDGHLNRDCAEVASQGCITIPGSDNWNAIKKIMANTKEKGVFKIHLKVI